MNTVLTNILVILALILSIIGVIKPNSYLYGVALILICAALLAAKFQ
jgi:uncharacterized membrane protein